MATLKEELPHEFTEGEYDGTRAYALRNVEVVRKVDGTEPGQGWPGPHVNVMNWYVLADGHIVGFNENTARGWSFHVRRLSGK
jgi:hypothetical protein